MLNFVDKAARLLGYCAKGLVNYELKNYKVIESAFHTQF